MKGNEAKGGETLEKYLKLYKTDTKNKDEENIFAELFKEMPEETFNNLVQLYNIKKIDIL
jgi:hypothetical protein